MAQIYNKMKIDIKEPVTDIITAKQNDSNSRFLDVYLYDGGVPIDLTGHELRIYMLKPDDTEIFNNGEITDAAAGRCQFELTDQALGAHGKLQCEISIWKDNVQILTTPTFDIHVVQSLRTNGSIESSNEYGSLVVLYQNLYESIDLMTSMVELFGEPGEVADAADIETFWQMLEYLYSVNDYALKNASVSEVLNRIGLNTDGEDAGTLFGYVNPLKTLISTFGNDIKSLINSYKPWCATYGTTTTLKSTTTSTELVVTDTYAYSEDYTQIFTFVAPKTGHYRLDAKGKAISTYPDSINYVYLQCCLGIKKGASKHLDISGRESWEHITTDHKELTANIETTLNGITADLFLEEGVSYYLGIGCHASYPDYCSGTLTSASIKYVKTACPSF